MTKLVQKRLKIKKIPMYSEQAYLIDIEGPKPNEIDWSLFCLHLKLLWLNINTNNRLYITTHSTNDTRYIVVS